MIQITKPTQLTLWGITAVVILSVAVVSSDAGVNDNNAINPKPVTKLSDTQKHRIAIEAQEAFDLGSQILPSDPNTARAKFAAAARKFQLLIDAGCNSGKLYYNLANAQLKSGQVGLAIANYKQAQLRLGTDNKKLNANLQYARSLLKTKVPHKDTTLSAKLAGWCGYFSMNTKLWITATAWSAFWVVIIVRLFLRRFRFRWRYLLGCTMLVFVLSAGACVYQWWWTSNVCEGVVVTPNVTVRKGNGRGFAAKFKETLPEGTEVRILEQRGQWLRVKLPDGKTGWIDSSCAEIIKTF